MLAGKSLALPSFGQNVFASAQAGTTTATNSRRTDCSTLPSYWCYQWQKYVLFWRWGDNHNWQFLMVVAFYLGGTYWWPKRIEKKPHSPTEVSNNSRESRVISGVTFGFLEAECWVTTKKFDICRLEPLVQRIRDKRTAVLCPMIDAISDETIAYPDYTGSVQVGGFSWSLFFTWEELPETEKQKTPIDIVRSELNKLVFVCICTFN